MTALVIRAEAGVRSPQVCRWCGRSIAEEPPFSGVWIHLALNNRRVSCLGGVGAAEPVGVVDSEGEK